MGLVGLYLRSRMEDTPIFREIEEQHETEPAASTELRELQAVYYNGGLPEAWVSINAKLVQMPRRAIVASQSFDSRVTATADALPDIVAAFDDAAGKVLRRLVEWTLLEGEKAFRDGRPRSS